MERVRKSATTKRKTNHKYAIGADEKERIYYPL